MVPVLKNWLHWDVGMLERCDSGDKRCKAGAACIGFKEAKTGDAALGTCHAATAAYVPSYSVRLQFLVRLLSMRSRVTHSTVECWQSHITSAHRECLLGGLASTQEWSAPDAAEESLSSVHKAVI